MHDAICKYFQLGTIQWMSHPPRDYALLDSLQALLKDPDFQAIEITHVADEETRKTVRDLLAQAHVRVCYGAQPRLLGSGLNPNDLDEEGRLEAERVLLDSVDEAAYLGAQGIAFLAGHYEQTTIEASYEQLVRTTTAVCNHAASRGMMVELEVFDFDMDKRALIGPAPRAARFAADMRSRVPNFGLVVDLSHFPTTYETSSFVIQTLRPYITHFHIGNAVTKKGCPAYGDKHPRFGFPNGSNDEAELLDFFQVLRREGFFRPENPYVLSFEVSPQEGENGEIIIANTKRVIRRAWARLED